MRYIIDHDFHIHSNLSLCSKDSGQTAERILTYAKEESLNRIVVTDHCWDAMIPEMPPRGRYEEQNIKHIESILPLPQNQEVEFLFGVETDMNLNGRIGIHPSNYDKFDFVIVPINHLHLLQVDWSIEQRAKMYVERYQMLLDADLPFEKVGIAHLTCWLIDNRSFQNHLEVIDLISNETFERLFEQTQKKGMGVELNIPINNYSEEQIDALLRPYQIAKKCGCKFYLGSDAHDCNGLSEAKTQFERIVNLLDLKEEDKYILQTCK